MEVLLQLWVTENKGTDRHVLYSTKLCPLINLFLHLVRNDKSNTVILTVLDSKSRRPLANITRTFCVRMEEIARLHREQVITGAFATDHLSRLAEILRHLLPCDVRHYWTKFICRENLLATLYQSWSSIMGPIQGANRCWTPALDGLGHIFYFVLRGGKYSGCPISKMADVLSGSVVTLLVGCLLNIPSTSSKYEAIINLLDEIGPHLMYRKVWAATCPYFPQDRVLLLPYRASLHLSAQSPTGFRAWSTFQSFFHESRACHIGGGAELLEKSRCDNLKVSDSLSVTRSCLTYPYLNSTYGIQIQ
jgi:hypothetical protein